MPSWPQRPFGWLCLAGFLALGIYSANVVRVALAATTAPGQPLVDLASPLGHGTYLIANGGAAPEAGAAAEAAPHQVAFYLRGLAGEFHSYYNAIKILKADARERLPRLALCVAVRQVLRNGLGLVGVSAPEKM